MTCIHMLDTSMPTSNTSMYHSSYLCIVVISTGTTTDSAAGALTLTGGTSAQGMGGDIDILGGQSTAAGTGGRVLIG